MGYMDARQLNTILQWYKNIDKELNPRTPEPIVVAKLEELTNLAITSKKPVYIYRELYEWLLHAEHCGKMKQVLRRSEHRRKRHLRQTVINKRR